MSADNGIYILSSPKSFKNNELEYRVIHTTNIEEIEWEAPNGEEFNPEILVQYFGTAMPLNEEESFKRAHDMHETVIKSGCPVEYGISTIKSKKPFSYFLHYASLNEESE